MEQTKKQLRRDTKIKKKYLEYYEKHKRDAYDKTKPKVKKYGEWKQEHYSAKEGAYYGLRRKQKLGAEDTKAVSKFYKKKK